MSMAHWIWRRRTRFTLVVRTIETCTRTRSSKTNYYPCTIYRRRYTRTTERGTFSLVFRMSKLIHLQFLGTSWIWSRLRGIQSIYSITTIDLWSDRTSTILWTEPSRIYSIVFGNSTVLCSKVSWKNYLTYNPITLYAKLYWSCEQLSRK